MLYGRKEPIKSQ